MVVRQLLDRCIAFNTQLMPEPSFIERRDWQAYSSVQNANVSYGYPAARLDPH